MQPGGAAFVNEETKRLRGRELKNNWENKMSTAVKNRFCQTIFNASTRSDKIDVYVHTQSHSIWLINPCFEDILDQM